MKCLHIITRLANGGAEESVLDLIKELSKFPIQCDLAVGRECSPEVLEKYDLPLNFKLHRLPHLVVNPHPIFDLLAYLEIKKLIRKNRYDLVHTHLAKAGVLGRLAASSKKVRVIIGTIHGITFPIYKNFLIRNFYRYVERFTAEVYDALVCVGDELRQVYLEAGIGKPEQYRVIYTGMNLKRVRKNQPHLRKSIQKKFNLPIDRNTIVLGYIGRFVAGKNQTELISMLPKILVTHPFVHLILIGNGPDFNRLTAIARRLRVENNISFTGYLKNIWDILPIIDIHCMVSLWEGLPRVLVQTSAAGIPNICYQVTGAGELIRDGKSGFIIPQGEKNEFIEKLNLLIKNRKLREDFGKNALKSIDQRWQTKTYGLKTYRLYREILEKKMTLSSPKTTNHPTGYR